MSNINRVILTGRLGGDAELKFTQGGLAIIEFGLAVNDYVGKEKGEYTNWINCTMFNREKLVNYLKKGMKVTVEGRLKQDRWETPAGEKRSKIGVIVSDIDLPGKNESTDQGPNYSPGGFEPTDDDIPF